MWPGTERSHRLGSRFSEEQSNQFIKFTEISEFWLKNVLLKIPKDIEMH